MEAEFQDPATVTRPRLILPISPAMEEASIRFACALVKSAHSAFFRGFRPAYITFVDAECSALVKHYEEPRNAGFTGHPIESLDRQR